MGYLNIKNNSFTINNIIKPKNFKQSIERLLQKTNDFIIVFDTQGKVIAINPKGTSLFNLSENRIIGHYIWELIELKSFNIKRQLVQAIHHFAIANQGLAQQFLWIESKQKKPIRAYDVVVNKSEIENTPVIFAKITDVLPNKMTEWVLWRLNKISNLHETNNVIDEVLKLVSDTFAADYASVSLVDNQKIAHTVSYYKSGKKMDNIHFSLNDSPCDKVILSKSICHFQDVQTLFPQDKLLKKMRINTYLAGPITNSNQEVIGLMTILTKRPMELDSLNNTIFGLLLNRINSEIERLMNLRKLEFLASIPQQNPNPLIRILSSGEIIYANEEGQKIVNYWKSKCSGLPEAILKQIPQVEELTNPINIEIEANDRFYLFSLNWVSEFKQINLYGTDITQLKYTEQDMINLARFDALTQIANRQYFEETLSEEIYEHNLKGHGFALLLIDLDNFKTINDTLGHPIGDKLLKAATKRMVRCIRNTDFIARLGGDEFIVIVHQANVKIASQVADKIINALSRNFQFGEYNMKISASIGIALYPEAGLSGTDLLKNADIAMYQSKKTGKNRFFVFSKSLQDLEDKRKEILKKEIKKATASHQLYIDYQPQFDLKTNSVIGIEALVRWDHPKEGLIPPGEFITIAEQTGCLHTISKWLIDRTFQDFVMLLETYPKLTLTINVSLSQLSDPRFIEGLQNKMLSHDIKEDQLILDVSERILAPHFKQISRNLKKIQHIGINLSLDNFNTPQISLHKLLTLPLDYLKIDQQMLVGIEKYPKYRTLLEGIINLGKNLGLKVIQKGVETKEQHQIICDLGCQFAQGYFYCKPVNQERLVDFLRSVSSKRVSRDSHLL
ncbi:EAL domain-containing protein [Legionella waltersii]|uniref:GGDEF domain-containing sensory box protein n=1 Tax=Legionella waltersii TaxID=66969 RepID=A0A0W1AD92_9GAMM|nr:EAL domain-containing protein [Legionella waltersii]KTD79240.1 GGDEF domain-containing sensory box protein [Legionella waltersii]SNV12677.1 signal transduction protein containing a membrane domain, an EAL and a GGDEF domain [Legionella waltersii]